MKPYHRGWGVALSSRWGDRRTSSKHDPHATAWTIMVGDAAVATSATSPQLTIGMAPSLAAGAVSRAPRHLSQLHMLASSSSADALYCRPLFYVSEKKTGIEL